MNAASTIMYSSMTIGLIGVVGVLWGYSLAFGPDLGGFVGNLAMGLRDDRRNHVRLKIFDRNPGA